jgi:hypothetical protein
MQRSTGKALVLMFAISSLWTSAAIPGIEKGQEPKARQVWSRTEVYFGANRPGGVVTEADFNSFLGDVVTPRFPDGLTLLTGYGQSRIAPGSLEKEQSRVLILIYPQGSDAAHQRIQEIREIYKKRFEQASVLRVDSKAHVSF